MKPRGRYRARGRPTGRGPVRAAIVACAVALTASGVALASLPGTPASSPAPAPEPAIISLPAPSRPPAPKTVHTARPVRPATNRAAVYSPAPTPNPPSSTAPVSSTQTPAQQVLAATAESAPQPIVGERATTTVVSGTVRIRLKGTTEFIALSGSISIPNGSEVDATNGRILLTVATGHAGRTVSAEVYGGVFAFHQTRGAHALARLALSQPLTGCPPRRLPVDGPSGRADLVPEAAAHHISEPSYRPIEQAGPQPDSPPSDGPPSGSTPYGSPPYGSPPSGSTPARSAQHRSNSKSRHLWVSEGGGNWGTGGRYVSTTVEGTRWLTLDECDRSEVHVAAGRVRVRNLLTGNTAVVSAGRSYTASFSRG